MTKYCKFLIESIHSDYTFRLLNNLTLRIKDPKIRQEYETHNARSFNQTQILITVLVLAVDLFVISKTGF
jgi:hypothetical protein